MGFIAKQEVRGWVSSGSVRAKRDDGSTEMAVSNSPCLGSDL